MDPRVARTHSAVIDAATQLLAEGGPDAMTMDAVVARSGVAKSTLYRHWATRDELVAEVFDSCAPELIPPDPDLDARSALVEVRRQLAASLADPNWRRLLPALLLLRLRHPEIADIESDLSSRQQGVMSEVLTRCVEDGVVGAAILDDVDRSLTLLLGPLVMAALLGPLDEDDDLADRCVTQFLAGSA
jgi:AcrR family transcriptional regulator